MPDDLLKILRCPQTLQPLRQATDEEVARLRRSGADIGTALVREDGGTAYPVKSGIPLLLAGEAITLD